MSYSDVIKARRYQLVELQVISAMGLGSQLYFQDQPQLRSQPDQLVIVDAVECYNEETVAVAPSGRQVVDAATMSECYLVLNIKGTDEFKYIPLNRLNPMMFAGSASIPSVAAPLLFDSITNVDWTKSYVQSAGTVSAGLSFLFGVFYRYQPGM
jgi:hypothetical protein